MTLTSTVVNDLHPMDLTGASHPRIIVCIPAYNEEPRIGPVVREASMFAEQVLVCDDGSSDHTGLEAQANGGRVLRHDRNLGKGAALRTLMLEAQKARPDIVVTLDGDGQHSPKDIPSLLVPILDKSAEVVIGSRFGNGNAVPRYRRVGNSLLSAMTNLSAKSKIRDTQSGFRAYSSRAFPAIMISHNGIGVDSEILIRLTRGGFKIAERDVAVKYGRETSTFNPLSHTFRVVWSLIRVFFER